MRRTLVAAAILAVSASVASAQAIGGACRGHTLGELADCIAGTAPPEAEDALRDLPDADQPGTAATHDLQPSRLGGALQPSKLRAGPAPSGGAVAPRRTNDTPLAIAPQPSDGPAQGRSPIVSYQPLR